MKYEPEILRGFSAAIIFLLYVVLWAIKRRAQIQQSGIDPEVIYKDKKPSQMFFASMLRIMTLSIIIILVLHTYGISDIPGFYNLFKLSDSMAATIGISISFFGLFICYVAQKTMGNAWRVGIDRDNITHLIESGIFSYSRNPTYLGLFLVCCGLFVLFPTMMILIWILVFLLLLEFQVRLEEEYMLENHRQAYFNYMKKVKRYIPWIY
ncbi:MAG: isoprenylcysteine carboxylmethyltransferase family protein [Candidatus Marinimicrobia bacterium]|nr:isoprenylcysteine carboxylmethyltransferase family protein [Candidatus Neomarinimicrobiota bacterium]